MFHNDHVQLILPGIQTKEGIWADLGSGEGAFTLALADITEQQVEIFSIDKHVKSLQSQKESFSKFFPLTNVHFIAKDFTKPLELPQLDGILMANSLHYVEDQKSFLLKIKKYLKPSGKLIIVEYNTDNGNYWVPYPLSFRTFKSIAEDSGFKEIRQLESVPSTFLNEIYSAVAYQ